MPVTINGSTGISSPGGDTSTSLSTGLLTVTGSTVPANGMYLPATNTLAWATNSTRNMTLDASGNLLLGIASGTVRFYSYNASGDNVNYFEKASGSKFVIYNSSSDSYVGTMSNTPLRFATNDVERARIDSSGRVTTPYQPAFRAFSNAGGFTSGNTVVPFDQTSLNIGNYYNTSTYTFTAPVSGSYLFAWSVSTNNNATNSLDLQINGSTVSYCETQTALTYFVRGQSQIRYLSAGDTARIIQRFGNTNLADPSTNFQGFLIG